MKNIISTLAAIETEMQQLQLWDDQRPSDSDLASTQPFCIDTLTLPQWIQFILIERLTQMIEQKIALPTQSGTAAIAEEYFKPTQTGENLIALLKQLDRQLSNQIG